jgi:hypothetical protein
MNTLKIYKIVCDMGCYVFLKKKKTWIVWGIHFVVPDVLHVFVNLVSRKQKIGPIILAALIAHHTPTLTSYKCAS